MNIFIFNSILVPEIMVNNYYPIVEPLNRTGLFNSDNLGIIISLFNLIFIIYFYLYDRKVKKDDDNIRMKSFWFRNIILEKNINDIEALWDNAILALKEIMISLDNKELKSNEAYIVLNKKRLLIKKINDYIRIIDKDYGDKLDLILDDLEDYFTNFIDDLPCEIGIEERALSINDFVRNIHTLKEKYFTALYKFELDGYCSKANK